VRLEILAAVVACASIGCSGAHASVEAPSARYPISLSRAVRDQDGTSVPDERLQTVAVYSHTRTVWALFYGALPLSSTVDVSDAVNEQVERAGGEAVTRFLVGTAPCWADAFIPLAWLPIWPSCARVVTSGRIVKVVPQSGPTVGAAP
jgi:hypothetical protein